LRRLRRTSVKFYDAAICYVYRLFQD